MKTEEYIIYRVPKGTRYDTTKPNFRYVSNFMTSYEEALKELKKHQDDRYTFGIETITTYTRG